ncbi:MAG: nucleoside transporter C-terminal domain-containing protein [Candidatus Obscuribacterales bacterium]|jgi:CNT family concentrative nucleoside transporter|nr:NupC/NupG family nucleoside CNT transporter [bacterium]
MTSKAMGLVGFVLILGTAYLMSNNRSKINYRLVISGLVLQLLLAIFVLKVEFGQMLFRSLGDGITQLLHFSDKGAGFVFGPLVQNPENLVKVFGPGADYIFAFRVVPTIIFVSSLVSISYFLGIMQKFVQIVAKIVSVTMGASGAEALSNAGSVFVGQVEAQLLIKPYVPTMTMSELLASMAGSMACVAGGVLAVYIGLGIKASYLLTASIMAAPGALVIAKIVWPETEVSDTKGEVKVEVKRSQANIIDAAAHGASEGLRIGLNVVGMLIAFIALIALCDAVIGWAGNWLFVWGMRLDGVGIDLAHLELKGIFGAMFAPVAFVLGVPWVDAHTVGRLMGEKLVINEFVAYTDLSNMLKDPANTLSAQAETIATFALCGFANFSSIAIQIGGIGEIAPNRREDLAKLGVKALICGTLASYLSATLAGLLT